MSNVPIFVRTPLHDEIGPEMMRRMREEKGMTNREIANACGVSAATVNKYIGKQGFRGGLRLVEEHVEEASKKDASVQQGVKTAPPKLLREKTKELHGEIATYKVDLEKKILLAEGPDVEMALEHDALVLLIRELLEVEQLLK